jgi:hypothetical protein
MSRKRPRSTTDPFEPRPRGEAIRGARFWPDTLFLDISVYPKDFQNLDIDHTRIFEVGDLDTLVALAARMHEQVHWLQTVGTTFGRFLAFTRITNADLAHGILATATDRERDILMDARRRGVAPAQRDLVGRLRHESGYSITVESLFDHWWSNLVLEGYLLDNDRSRLGPVDPRFMVGLALRYAAAGDRLRDVFNEPDANFMKTTRGYGPVDDAAAPELRSGLTELHIEEGAALVVQATYTADLAPLLSKARYRRYRQRSRKWTTERFLDDPASLYCKALSYYTPYAPAVSETRHFDLFLLLCDIALNPHIPDDGSPLDRPWSDFHPVLRFERLVAALNGFVADDREENGAPPSVWWIEERARLVARAGLSDGAADHAFARPVAPDSSPFVAPTTFLRALIASAGANLDTIRTQYPAVTASLTNALDPGADGFYTTLRSIDGPSFYPPLIIGSDGSGWGSTIDAELYANAVIASTILRAIQSWLAFPGPLNFRGLPSDQGPRIARDIAKERLGIYGISLSSNDMPAH